MKKLIVVSGFMLAVLWRTHAQVDSVKIKTDSSAIQHKADPNRERKQDSINERKKMPPRKNTTLLYFNDQLLDEMKRGIKKQGVA